MRLRGFCIWRCLFDIMHSMDLGILQVIIPAVMIRLTSRKSTAFRGRKRQARFDDAYKRYRQCCIGFAIAPTPKTIASGRVPRGLASGPGPKDSLFVGGLR